MKISLIMATVGRTAEISNLLISLNGQKHRDFELIIVDQNKDDRLVSVLKNFQDKFSIIHLRSELGLSRARNVGLSQISGDLVAFPDDDCEYLPETLYEVHDHFTKNASHDVLTCMSVDKITGLPSNSKWRKTPTEITVGKVFETAISYTIFYKSNPVTKEIRFNLLLGLGAPYGSAEETDFLLKLLESGCKAYYRPDIHVYHPHKTLLIDENLHKRSYSYGLGLGALFHIHASGAKVVYLFLPFVEQLLLRPILGCMVNIVRGKWDKAKVQLYGFYGKWKGLLFFNENI